MPLTYSNPNECVAVLTLISKSTGFSFQESTAKKNTEFLQSASKTPHSIWSI